MKQASKDLAALRSVVERQSGALRSLSIAMHTHSEHAAFLTRGERRIVASWAEAIREIADELTQAMAEDDPSRIQRLKRAAHALVVPLAFAAGSVTTGAAEGVAGSVAEAWLTDEIAACASEAQSSLEELQERFIPSDESTQIDEATTVSLPDALRSWRAITRTRQSDISGRLGVARATWARWESGEHRPNADSLMKLFSEVDEEVQAAETREPIDAVANDWRASDDYLHGIQQVRAALLEEMYQRNMPPPFRNVAGSRSR